MSGSMNFENFYQHDTDVYSLEGFKPAIVDRDYLKNLGVDVEPSDETLKKLTEGSRIFMERLKNRTVIPVSRLETVEIDPETVETEIHNYTGRCPTLTFELNPVKGCNVGCQYCLVTDGVHEQQLIAYENYHHEITLPCYPQLTDEQVRFVIKTVIEAYHTIIKK